ncbi:hypothetical protein KBD45_00855 [Candidatus Dojkabacteria bacterium]|nr:hypothetical protein [Candidatus Dojkabacteria bacterium]
MTLAENLAKTYDILTRPNLSIAMLEENGLPESIIERKGIREALLLLIQLQHAVATGHNPSIPLLIEGDPLRNAKERHTPPCLTVNADGSYNTQDIPIHDAERGIIQPQVCRDMKQIICPYCPLIGYALERRAEKIALGERVDPYRRVYQFPTTGNGTLTISDEPIEKAQKPKRRRSRKYDGCDSPSDYRNRILYRESGFTSIGNLLHNLNARRFKRRLERQNIWEFHDPSLHELFSPDAGTRQITERVALDINGNLIEEHLPRFFDREGEEVDPISGEPLHRSIPWSDERYTPLDNNAYQSLCRRVENLERDIENQVSRELSRHGYRDFIAFPEVNLTYPGSDSIGPFLDNFQGDISQHISLATPDSQLLFHAVFLKEKGEEYLAKVKGRPDNIIFASKGLNNPRIVELAKRFANLAYNSDNSSIHLFNPNLYRNAENIGLIRELSTAIRTGEITLVVQESKFGDDHKEKEAREEAAHYILALFCLFSAFDESITLDALIENSRIIIDSNQIHFHGPRADLANFIVQGASIQDRFEMLDQEETKRAVINQLTSLFSRLDNPSTLFSKFSKNIS